MPLRSGSCGRMSRPLKLKVHGAAYQRLSNSPIMGSKGTFAGAHRRCFPLERMEEPSLSPLHAIAELHGMFSRTGSRPPAWAVRRCVPRNRSERKTHESSFQVSPCRRCFHTKARPVDCANAGGRCEGGACRLLRARRGDHAAHTGSACGYRQAHRKTRKDGAFACEPS